MLYAQVVYLDVAVLNVVGIADEARVSMGSIHVLTSAQDNAMRPFRLAVKSLDRRQIEAVAPGFSAKFLEARQALQDFVAQMQIGAEVSGKVIAALDAAMIVYSIYQAGLALSSGGMGPPTMIRVPAIGSVSGGAAAMAAIRIPAEALEAIRQLIAIGAISSALVGIGIPGMSGISAGSGTIFMRATPSGSVTPASGPEAGRPNSFGDNRHKHTKTGNESLADMKSAVASRPTTPGSLQELHDAAAHSNKAWGSQLSKEATDRYADLVKNALENGVRKSATWYDHTASFEVGIDVVTKSATRNYRMFFDAAKGGWHLFPVP
jgi:hypothetical protein